MKTKIEFTRVSNDINGNTRYVCAFFNLLTAKEYTTGSIGETYLIALNRAKKIGGGSFDNKKHPNSMVFTSDNINKIENKIQGLLNY